VIPRSPVKKGEGEDGGEERRQDGEVASWLSGMDAPGFCKLLSGFTYLIRAQARGIYPFCFVTLILNTFYPVFLQVRKTYFTSADVSGHETRTKGLMIFAAEEYIRM